MEGNEPSKVPNSVKNIVSYSAFVLVIVYLVGLINLEYKAIGLEHPFLTITDNYVLILDVIFWAIVGLFSVELFISYLKVRNSKEFLRKYWLEIIMLVLMPIFVGFKLLKITLKIVKQIKIGKTVFKIIHKIKK
ncbi:MAG: hypothetical protein DWQ18_03305 [Crenarchaeota archaeon]|nr:MAG: hypothetical protein DWQ17_05220 [Thermoproteota archaeon]RDJ34339.1 MAG: hypothetical protein DWQ18_03305 [Thermoproteota archaeon]RDJ36940.1 MAG: hypothetical protein DWQ13_07310 [Thermoproteota archaeon]RDJ37525.1 MAG: hypothetical protein DWQ19_03525 [Thermoproteota archaeon]